MSAEAVMQATLRVLLVGTGRMGETHARRFAEIPGVQLAAAVDVNATRLRSFCARHHIPRAFASIDEALNARSSVAGPAAVPCDFDVVSVATPDALHAPVSLSAIAAGLPVLCEKPLSDTLEGAVAMADAAAVADVPTLVNLAYRSSGALHAARAAVEAGTLGELRHVNAAYLQSWLVSPYWGDWKTEDAWLWRLSRTHGSLGVLGDVGIHILDFLLAGTGLDIDALHCRLHNFDKAPGNRIGEYTLDANDSCVMTVQLENGALGVVHMSRFATGHMNSLELTMHGTLGAARVELDQTNGDRLTLCVGDDIHTQTWRDMKVHEQPDIFDRFVAAVRNGDTDAEPGFRHAANLQQLLELAFSSDRESTWLGMKTTFPSND